MPTHKLPQSEPLDDAALAVSMGEWVLPPLGEGIDEDWLDSFIAVRLADVLSRRHYGVSFHQLSVEDRLKIRGACESFVARQTYIQKREAQR